MERIHADVIGSARSRLKAGAGGFAHSDTGSAAERTPTVGWTCGWGRDAAGGGSRLLRSHALASESLLRFFSLASPARGCGAATQTLVASCST